MDTRAQDDTLKNTGMVSKDAVKFVVYTFNQVCLYDVIRQDQILGCFCLKEKV